MSSSENHTIELWHRTLLAQDYALINPLQVDADFWADLPTTPIVPAGLESREDIMPRLVALKAMTRDARVGVLDRIEQHKRNSKRPLFSAFIIATRSTESMAHTLARKLAIRDPNNNAALFRFYDPAVFAHLRWLLDDDQFSRLLQSVQAWTWRDANGQWQQTRPAQKVPRSSFRLTLQQWDTLRRVGLINRCLKQINKKAADTDITNAKTAKTIDDLLRQSHERLGLTDADARCLYVQQAMCFDPDIHRHPDLRERLDQARSGTDYVSACADLDDTAMLQLVETLHRPEKAMI